MIPSLLYHGTVERFEVFERRRSLPIGALGYWFAADPAVALMVALRKTNSPVLIEAEVSVINPLVVERGLRGLVDLFDGEVTPEAVEEMRSKIMADGFDGILLNDVIEDGGCTDNVIALHPDQIRILEIKGPMSPEEFELSFKAHRALGSESLEL